MPTLTFDIQKDSIINLIDTKIGLKGFLDSVLFDQNGADINEIGQWLLAFHKDNGGAPVISELDIADGDYDAAQNTGKVKFTYQVSVSFGCADIFRTDDHTETCKFQIDTESNKLILFITDHITRDTVDEF